MSLDDIHQNAIQYPTLSNILQYTHYISLGADYVNFYDAKSEAEQGGVLMGHFEYGVHVYLFPGIFLKKINNENFLDLYYIGITRPEVNNETSDKKDWRPLQKYGIALSFKQKVSSVKEREIKLALEKIFGEDILKGLAAQEYWQIALKVKI